MADAPAIIVDRGILVTWTGRGYPHGCLSAQHQSIRWYPIHRWSRPSWRGTCIYVHTCIVFIERTRGVLNSLWCMDLSTGYVSSRMYVPVHFSTWPHRSEKKKSIYFDYVLYMQCILARTYPNFIMLSPRWVCLFWYFQCTRSAQKGISKITCVTDFLLQPSSLTR